MNKVKGQHAESDSPARREGRKTCTGKKKIVKGKGKGNYLTSVAKQAKTAFLHGPTV